MASRALVIRLRNSCSRSPCPPRIDWEVVGDVDLDPHARPIETAPQNRHRRLDRSPEVRLPELVGRCSRIPACCRRFAGTPEPLTRSARDRRPIRRVDRTGFPRPHEAAARAAAPSRTRCSRRARRLGRCWRPRACARPRASGPGATRFAGGTGLPPRRAA